MGHPSLIGATTYSLAVVFFAIGPGCAAWFVLGELLPPYARDAAAGLGVALHWAAGFALTAAFPSIHAALGPYTYLGFALAAAGFGGFAYRCVPETAGRSLSEVTAEFLSTSP